MTRDIERDWDVAPQFTTANSAARLTPLQFSGLVTFSALLHRAFVMGLDFNCIIAAIG